MLIKIEGGRGEGDGSRALTTHQRPHLTGIQVPRRGPSPSSRPRERQAFPGQKTTSHAAAGAHHHRPPVPDHHSKRPSPHRPQRYRDVATGHNHKGRHTASDGTGRAAAPLPPASASQSRQVTSQNPSKPLKSSDPNQKRSIAELYVSRTRRQEVALHHPWWWWPWSRLLHLPCPPLL